MDTVIYECNNIIDQLHLELFLNEYDNFNNITKKISLNETVDIKKY